MKHYLPEGYSLKHYTVFAMLVLELLVLLCVLVLDPCTGQGRALATVIAANAFVLLLIDPREPY